MEDRTPFHYFLDQGNNVGVRSRYARYSNRFSIMRFSIIGMPMVMNRAVILSWYHPAPAPNKSIM